MCIRDSSTRIRVTSIKWKKGQPALRKKSPFNRLLFVNDEWFAWSVVPSLLSLLIEIKPRNLSFSFYFSRFGIGQCFLFLLFLFSLPTRKALQNNQIGSWFQQWRARRTDRQTGRLVITWKRSPTESLRQSSKSDWSGSAYQQSAPTERVATP